MTNMTLVTWPHTAHHSSTLRGPRREPNPSTLLSVTGTCMILNASQKLCKPSRALIT